MHRNPFIFPFRLTFDESILSLDKRTCVTNNFDKTAFGAPSTVGFNAKYHSMVGALVKLYILFPSTELSKGTM